MKQHQRHHIVILGAGFAGLAAALELERLRDFSKHEYNVTLIDKNCYHLYHALLYEVATAHRMVKAKELEALRSGVCIRVKSLGNIFLKHEVSLIQDAVVRINVQDGLLQLTAGGSIHFDELIVALGSVSNDFGIPGLAQYSVALKELPDALDINLRLQALLQRAQQGEKIQMVIGGGGISGVETAGELQHYINKLARQGKLDKKNIAVHVMEAGPSILMGFDAWAQTAARRRLASLGVTIHTAQPIVKVEEKVLTLKDQSVLPFDLLLWSGGIKAHPLIANLDVPLSPKGQALVDPTLQIQNSAHVYVVGDGVALMDPKTNKPVPQTVSEAVAQGRQAAANVFRSVHGQARLTYTPRRSGFVFPVGGRWAVSTMGGFKLAGFFGWIVRKLVDLDYFLSILTFKKAWHVFWAGGRVYLRND
jgi:NADH dehydrogenase